MDLFFTGLHQPSDAGYTTAGFISVVRLRKRKKPLRCSPNWPWVMDSGAFSTITTHGGYPDTPESYASDIRRWAGNGRLMAAVSQDYMCEPHMLAITGLTVTDHQRLTIERYDTLAACDTAGVYVMPVLQGYAPEDYASHVRQYGARLKTGMWVGVGSVCKRNGDPAAIERVLSAIRDERADLKLHGFGIKTTALRSVLVRRLLHSADSMAWSFAARKSGGNANDWRTAQAFSDKIYEIISKDKETASTLQTPENSVGGMGQLLMGSVCSGIGGAELAFSGLADCAFAAETEPFPRAVLNARFPRLRVHGDMLDLIESPEPCDILVGGTPCQAFSIAGRRLSLDDARGNLTLAFSMVLDAVDEANRRIGRGPAACLWENVPGVLSTDDNAFGCLLAAELHRCGNAAEAKNMDSIDAIDRRGPLPMDERLTVRAPAGRGQDNRHPPAEDEGMGREERLRIDRACCIASPSLAPFLGTDPADMDPVALEAFRYERDAARVRVRRIVAALNGAESGGDWTGAVVLPRELWERVKAAMLTEGVAEAVGDDLLAEAALW